MIKDVFVYNSSPKDIRVAILRILPLEEQFRVRLVCKTWKTDVSEMKNYDFRKMPFQLLPSILSQISKTVTEELFLSKPKYTPLKLRTVVPLCLPSFRSLTILVWAWPCSDNVDYPNQDWVKNFFSEVALIPSLRTFITNAREIQPKNFENLEKLTNLTHLEIRPLVNNSGVFFSGMTQLQKLRFFSGGSLSLDFSGLVNLKELHSGSLTIPSNFLFNSPNIEILNLYSSAYVPSFTNTLIWRNLKHLYLSIPTNTDMKFLENLQNTLQTFYSYLPSAIYNAEDWMQPSVAMKYISGCRNLTHLKFLLKNASDMDYQLLAMGCPDLELIYCEKNDCITDVTLYNFGCHLPNLTEVSLRGCYNLTKKGILHLSQLKKLRHLDLRGVEFNPEDTKKYLSCDRDKILNLDTSNWIFPLHRVELI